MHPSELFNANRPPDVTKIGLDSESEHPKFEFDPKAELREEDWQDMRINIRLSIADRRWLPLVKRAIVALTLDPSFDLFDEFDPVIRKHIDDGWITWSESALYLQYKHLAHPEAQVSQKSIEDLLREVKELGESTMDSHTKNHIETIYYVLDKVGHHQAPDHDLINRYSGRWNAAVFSNNIETIEKLMTIFGDQLILEEEKYEMLLENFRNRSVYQSANLGGWSIMEAVCLRNIAKMMNERNGGVREADNSTPLPEVRSF